ncbi:hypothetical protein I545_2661 [Mycobacterium kansasii 662]|uniref:Uncharacterized protein n=1 Tax=Mycobacterium kansasii 662 TaxID=1299326 RepID=X7ZIG8_MYCKA|nr:hypothetical protein I545_2661 [Mycobacterium kansasii 662]KEP40567.1 hypothetical protein MKSMC1_42840 [Mycobacterium kansasii]
MTIYIWAWAADCVILIRWAAVIGALPFASSLPGFPGDHGPHRPGEHRAHGG